ncbi:succinate-semialdehyde dehydrogenase, mitochondrial-like [Anneissia japonica]|uniref:succinate-semialdehyde dehydrogenase, mitochondrial-like n=1 Tax=Anneissia japonica TaxID=1529436 RepID=UPI0014257BF3|nr:succinate-semialdehyde dehydrogenase, mitochondrial-like [Anneissia japonica]
MSGSSLLKNKCYVNGKWIGAKDGATFSVTNPSTGEIVGDVPDMVEGDAVEAIAAADKAFQTWSETTAKERCQILHKWNELILKNKEELAAILTKEMGKPLKESMGEVGYGSTFVDWFAEEARRVCGDVIAPPAKGRKLFAIREPVGVAGMITPWNFPHAMITRKAAAALAAGCTVVLKPAEDTPFSALALCELADQAGFPPGVLNIITCSRPNAVKVGNTICTSPLVAKISFTGSTAVGKILLASGASTVKKFSLELGGNAPFIVFDSADVDRAVTGLMVCKFRNTGQTCVCANRILVHEKVYDSFVEKVVVAMKEQLHVKDGLDPKCTVGPLINQRAVEKVESHISDALSKGGKLVLGGKRHELGGTFFEPTLISDATANMMFCTEETFGPMAAIMKFKTEKEAVKIANDSRAGLAGYFYSNDLSQVWRVADKLNVGIIGINEGLVSCVEGPFGGVKESGFGTEGSKYGIEDYLHIKYVCIGGL